jgi:hypothetical protein
MALTTERNTIRYGAEPTPALYTQKVKASTKCYAGGIAVLDAGYLAPGYTATDLVALGRFEKTVDNSAGAAGALTADVLSGCFKWANSAGDALAQADVGALCYIEDDLTVCKTATGKSIAGRVVSIETDGVFVLMGLGVGK